MCVCVCVCARVLQANAQPHSLFSSSRLGVYIGGRTQHRLANRDLSVSIIFVPGEGGVEVNIGHQCDCSTGPT